ncbi:MAG: hypothetical protein IBX46_11375 [Desulfuromonadales bacterium]|nr:hypothetical protein [Desulfuromonadales bacterium]
MDYDDIINDFNKRTKKLLDSYDGEYDVTLLVNCCLGLLVLPKEKCLKDIPDIEIPIDSSIWGINRKSVTVKCDKCGYKLPYIIKKIRNGICHFDIKSIPNENKNIEFLEIKDRDGFKATFSIDQLKELAVSLSNHLGSH